MKTTTKEKCCKCIPFGFGSESNEQIDNNTFDICIAQGKPGLFHVKDTVSAGDQLSFKMSRHMCPLLLILQWYLLVVKEKYNYANYALDTSAIHLSTELHL